MADTSSNLNEDRLEEEDNGNNDDESTGVDDGVIFQVTDAEEDDQEAAASASAEASGESAWDVLLKKRLDMTDPEIVKRIWMNQRRDLDKQLKVGRRLNLTEPIIPFRMNKASFLRERNVELEKVRKRNLEAQMARLSEVGRDVPDYKESCPRQNWTSQFRYKFVRNNPVVSSYYIEHFEKHRKPPFITSAAYRCKATAIETETCPPTNNRGGNV